MKIILYSTLTIAAALAIALCAANLRAAETNNTAAVRVGLYDSRAVAYAWFWSANHQKQLNEMIQNARAAKTAGDTNRFQEIDAALRRQQDEIHREVFSTAPPTEALAEIHERLPEIQKAAGVSALVSKWDRQTLKQYRHAERVDVTDRLVRELNPNLTEKQSKVISGFKKTKPLPLKRCNELIRKGKI